MLGEVIGEMRGKVTGGRVLPSEGIAPKVETSFQQSGKILGEEVTDMGTYLSVARAFGGLFGEGQGVTMTMDGEVGVWKGQGVGRFTGHGSAVSFRGAIFYQSTSAKLARLNSIAILFEFDIDEKGNTFAKFWEWK